MRYEYVCVITGQLEAEGDEDAQAEAQRSITLSARLLQTPSEIAIRVKPLEPPPASVDGHNAKRKGVFGWLRSAVET